MQAIVSPSHDQNYFFTGSQRFPHSYQQTANGFIDTQHPFSNSPSTFGTFRDSSFVPNTDLDTSDLPSHLQRTLPQYHQLGLFDNQRDQSKLHPPAFNSPIQNTNSARFTQQIAPSTHRPSYSHLFSKNSHNHDPSQTETFLGEITIQSPAELPAEFQNRNIGGFQPSIHFPIQPALNKFNNKNNNSKPSSDVQSEKLFKPPQVVDQNLDFIEKPTPSRNNNQLGGISKPNYLNHRTRIFAPEPGNRPQINNYYVNNDGEVFITTKKVSRNSQFSTAIPSALSKQHRFNPTTATSTTEDVRTIENTFNLDSLLEEPLDKSEHSSNKDNVEVIQAVTLSPDKFFYPNINNTDQDDEYEYETTELYDDETTEVIEDATENTEVNTINGNLTNDDHDFNGERYSKPKNVDSTNDTNGESNYDVLTMKPSAMVKDDNFNKFVDSSVIDNTTDLPPENNPLPNLENAVVSVVTTKSIINNTVIGTLPENQNVTVPMVLTTQSTMLENTNHHSTTGSQILEQLTSPHHNADEETSTEGWVVVASVQTSRSVSGARYLPFPVVEQHERTKFLNEPETDKNNTETDEITTTTTNNESSTLLTREKQNTSTESLIDKLDRVQSDLSSSLLTGSFNNGGNNIAVITEGLLDKSDETTMFDSPTTTNASTQNTSTPKPVNSGPPPVVIRKFSPHARPTTPRSKLAFKLRNQSRKVNSPLDAEKPQGDQPIKLLLPEIKSKNGTTGRSSGISNQNQIIVQDVNQPKEADLTQRTLENILNKINFKESNAFLPPGYQEKIESQSLSDTNKSLKTDDILKNITPADISAFLPPGYKAPVAESSSKPSIDLSMLLPSDHKPKSALSKPNGTAVYRPSFKNPLNKTDVFKKSKQDDVSALLPPGYKPPIEENSNSSDMIENILKKIKQDNIAALLPPGYKPPEDEKSKNKSDVITGLLKKSKQDDLSAFLPPGYKPPGEEKPKDVIAGILKKSKEDDVSAFLPPGYKSVKSTTAKPQLDITKLDDIRAFLPPGFKLTTEKSNIDSILPKSNSDDLSKFLPPGYKPPKEENESSSDKKLSDLFENAKQDDVGAFLPPGYKSRFSSSKSTTTTETSTTTVEQTKETTTSSNFKVVFPSRPGGVNRKTQKPSSSKDQGANTPLTIVKGWPSRATTEFTGWPTPSTTPLSIEKLLERARAAVGATTSTTSATVSTTTVTTTTTTTTTPRPTTPGMCVSECDLAGTIKLIGGAKWVPELLDRNTKEWQILANEVQYQLEDVYSKSDVLSKWYKKIRIDGFSKGSVLVDYLVELNNVSREINTKDLKGLFHDALEEALAKNANTREAKSSDLGKNADDDNKLLLGNFMVDPTYTDFVVLPKQILPTVGYAEDNVLLPQWAIAIIVIGLASLLFVIIFGVTVIINKQKNAKKKQPSTLTEEMLNELNKNHMGGIDNYGAEDLYNMEDVWNDKPYETKLPKKRSAGSLHDNSMPNIYDSWRSEWNGYYYNTYYGNHPGSSHSGYGRRRSDYDTNF
ncbi:hypothetical protein FQR65_LT06220 [Abscondita terminalis]|nr:hypothetical protein FQR65_LT06220 [Abscondita terminalis]